jgi:MFS transporter, ACS family, glucarate transporter
MIPLFLTRNLTILAICLAAAFFFAEMTIGPMWAIPMDIAPRYAGSASGIMNCGSALAAILSPVTFGYIIDRNAKLGTSIYWVDGAVCGRIDCCVLDEAR